MKTIKVMLAIILIAGGSLMAQNTKTATKENPKQNNYFVQIPHNPSQCHDMLSDMKEKGETYLSKFWFGCLSGDHTAYGILKGSSEDEIRKMLPKEEQGTARIQKVDRLTVVQINQMHTEQK